MKILVYSPYLDTLGGGERYILTVASYLSRKHEVDIAWNDPEILHVSSKHFNIPLSNIHIVQNIFRTGNLLNKFLTTRQYDLFIYLTDGSIPMTFAKKNILHIQSPLEKFSFPWWKLRLYQAIVVNSVFTKQHIPTFVSSRVGVIYPPVDTLAFNSATVKKKQILSVGRFSSSMQDKNQMLLIDTFKSMKESRDLDGWRLVLAGGLQKGEEKLYQDLVKKAGVYDIDIIPDCPFEKMVSLYESSSLYWHAAGYGQTLPMKMEHFGISVVESMAAGCVPVVYDGGGLPEIVRNGTDGYTWKTTHELKEKSRMLIMSQKKRENMALKAIVRSKEFSSERFEESWNMLIMRLCGNLK